MKDITQTVDLSPGCAKDGCLKVLTSSPPLFARLSPVLILFILLLLLAGCGPSDSGVSSADLSAATQRIALDFQARADLAAAKSALAGLDVPNANQLLILTAETAISAGDVANADALTRLSLALSLVSSNIERYAQSRGFFAAQSQTASQTTGAEQPTAQPTDTPQALAENPTATPTPEAATPTSEAATATPEPATATPATDPKVRPQSAMNVRSGPGTNYAVVGALNAGDTARVTGKNAAGDWWQIVLASGGVGWVYGPFVATSGDTGGVAVAEAPPAPPTATPAPVQPTNTPAPAPSGVDFKLVEKQLWTVEETGGFRDGTSVNCQGGVGLLRVIVWDVNGNPLNGVTVKGIHRFEQGNPLALIATGQKGPGIAEFDMNTNGDDITVFRDVDGREVTSDVAYNNTGVPENIEIADLIRAGYCTDEAQCRERKIQDPFACYGHYSWTVTFQRTY